MSELQKYSVGKAHLIRVEPHWKGNQWDTGVYKECEVDARLALMQRAVEWCLSNGAHSDGDIVYNRWSERIEVPAEFRDIIKPREA